MSTTNHVDANLWTRAQMNTYRRWLDRVKDISNPWSESEITYFRKYVNDYKKDWDDVSGLIYEMDRQASLSISSGNTGYYITLEQTVKGLHYLRSKTYKQNGELRKGNIFGSAELAILDQFSMFRLVGLYMAGNYTHRNYLPIYRVYDTSGNYFDYTGTTYDQIAVVNSSYVNMEVA